MNLANRIFLLSFVLLISSFLACSSDDDNTSVDGDTDLEKSETEEEKEIEEAIETEPEIEEEAEPEGLPTSFDIEFKRESYGEPLSKEEVTEFTKKLTGFMAKAEYYKWLLRTSYGVHESTGKRDFMLWWTGSHAEKTGDVVSFVHNETSSPTSADGGHNMMTRSSKVLASAISGYLMSGDESMKTVAEQYCKGVTSTMLGMVYDENDKLHHLMARNVAMFNHEYTTWEGNKKKIDYSPWYHSGGGWNCKRFEFPNNPSWGSVWVTNMRSKDDISRVLRVTAVIRYASEMAKDESVKEACGEAYDYLKLFAKDIVDSGYFIRSKDENGKVFIPGQSGNKEDDDGAGDLASYVDWELYIPNAECNPKRAAALIAYGNGLDNDCGETGVNEYEEMAMRIHYFNIWLVRSTHISHIMQALSNRDYEAAKKSLKGLEKRYQRDVGYDAVKELERDQDSWDRDVASSLMQAIAVGYPLNGEEARLVKKFYDLSIEKYSQWTHWNLWDKDIEDGRYEYRPPNSETIDEVKHHWIRIEDMGAFLDACWSPFVNPEGVKLLDCDIVRDPSKWDPKWLDE